MLIQVQNLRDWIGKHNTSWTAILPLVKGDSYHLPRGSLLELRLGKRSLRSQPWETDDKYFTADQSGRLRVLLTRDIGLTGELVNTLLKRPKIHFKRIEEFISGLVDSLWLGSFRQFEEDSPYLLIIRSVVRKIFCVGTYDLGLLHKFWKEWTNYFVQHSCNAELLEVATLGFSNFFRDFNNLIRVKELINENLPSNEQLEYVSHMSSTRQMPYMGKATEIAAEEKYIRTLSSEYEPDEEFMQMLYHASRRIGRKCRELRGGSHVNDGVPHISVTSSGEIHSSISKGGQAATVLNIIDERLTVIPDHDYIEDTIFGPAMFKKDVPIWKTLFVPEESEQYCTVHNWRDTYNTIRDQPNGFWGLGEFLGQQILYLAWKDSVPLPKLKATCVPELGNKARMVTVSEYWLNILQSPLSHTLKDFLKVHPYCKSSFTRGDQTWEALKSFGTQKHSRKFSMLSSDLTAATDTISFKVARQLLRGFINGCGFSYEDNPYINTVLGLIGPREVEMPSGDVIITNCGVMMGEAIAKPVLTIYGLAMEEIAYLKTLNSLNLLTSNYSPEVYWRKFHLGGDDHLAYGPNKYLDNITKTHIRAGSQISGDKHAKSSIAVKYCERMVSVRNLPYRRNKPYENSPVVDSIKVRLMTQGQSTLLSKDQKNVAVGKASQISKTLNWLPHTYDGDRIKTIQNLFIVRMKGLIPSEEMDKPGFNSVCLPKTLGGYELGLTKDLKTHLQSATYLIQCVANAIYLGDKPTESLKALKRLNRNVSKRAIGGLQDYAEEIKLHFNEYPSISGAVSASKIIEDYPADGFMESKRLAEADGYLSVSDFAESVTRGTLFQELLQPGSERLNFQTKEWRDEYRHVRKVLIEEVSMYGKPDYDMFNIDVFRNRLSQINTEYFVKPKSITTFDFGIEEDDFDFQDRELLEGFLTGRPALRCPTRMIGFR